MRMKEGERMEVRVVRMREGGSMEVGMVRMREGRWTVEAVVGEE